MSADEWYRNKDWNADIEAVFQAKLKRARTQKAQYLRIQANYLIRSHPRQCLKLLEQFFALKDKFDYAQAYVDRAEAYIALENVDEAVIAYRAALAREKEFPRLQTQAYLKFPYLIASRNLIELFDEAFHVLDDNSDRRMFPIDHYHWNASKALIYAATPDFERAREFARFAIKASKLDESGFRYHPKVGLFRKQTVDEIIYKKLIKLAK